MRFVDTAFDRSKLYSIGREMESGRYYLSIPVSHGVVDFEEYYEIPAEMHDGYPANRALIEDFADRCHRRLNVRHRFWPPPA